MKQYELTNLCFSFETLVYVGRTLSNFLFLVQCQLFTKVTWNATLLKPASPRMADGNMEGDYDESQSYEYNNRQYDQEFDYGNDQESNEWR